MITTDAPPCPFCGTIAIAIGAAWRCPTDQHVFMFPYEPRTPRSPAEVEELERDAEEKGRGDG